MTTSIADLVGLTEIADRYGVNKNVASGWTRKPGFPEPELKLAMGQMWDWRKVQDHLDPHPITKITDETGKLTLTVRTPNCSKCNILADPVPDTLRMRWTPERGCQVEFDWKCAIHLCGAYGTFSTTLSKEDL